MLCPLQQTQITLSQEHPEGFQPWESTWQRGAGRSWLPVFQGRGSCVTAAAPVTAQTAATWGLRTCLSLLLRSGYKLQIHLYSEIKVEKRTNSTKLLGWRSENHLLTPHYPPLHKGPFSFQQPKGDTGFILVSK